MTMLHWLRQRLMWWIAGRELAELQRWRVQWHLYRRWLAEFPDVGEAMAKAFAQYLGTSIPALAGARAGGGPVSAGSAYLVGERGPEVVVPATAGYVLPSGAVGSQVTNISFNGVTIRSESSQDVETLKRFVTMAGRQNQGGLR